MVATYNFGSVYTLNHPDLIVSKFMELLFVLKG